MTVVLTILSIPLLLFGAVGVLGNLWMLAMGIAGKWRGSFIPIPGVFAAVGMLLLPTGALRCYAWIPLLVDPSSVGAVALMCACAWRRVRR